MRFLYIALFSIATAGCMVGPDFKSPTAPQVLRYTEKPLPQKTAPQSQFFAAGHDVPGQWWGLFHSPKLNTLICTGLENSPTLQAAQAAVRQAQETWRAQFGALLLPSIDGQFSAVRQRAVTILPGAADSFGGSSVLASTFNQFNAQANFSYALDIFGGARRELEMYCAQVDYQQFQLEAAYLTLTANIVTTAITMASLREQVIAMQSIIRSQQSQLSILKQQFELGAVSGVEVLTQETQVAQTRALLPPLQLALAKSRDALATLIGKFPSCAQLPNIDLDALSLPKKLPVSLPSCLVRQRPDIRAQEALLHAASANVGVATANLFPKITLTGSYGWESNSLSRLFTPQSVIWNAGVGILQPIFHGGSLHAERRAAIAAYEQACAVYRQTVLQAFQNVADSLESIKHDADTLLAQQRAEIVARKTLALTQQQYRLGGINYLVLLNAERQFQQATINRIQAQAARYVDTAALFQALGGGWWNCDSPAQQLKGSRV
ncbi:MAG: efflux transporter outer membrane subunit [Pseudomonadota bacterium]|nr:efflux transporter outer membrane subunit [Pseudomonadota bacterium]